MRITNGFSLPMRDGNSISLASFTLSTGFSLPMRDGNMTTSGGGNYDVKVLAYL